MKAGDVVKLKGDRGITASGPMTVEKVTEEGFISCIYFRDGFLKEVKITKECLEVVQDDLI